MPPTIVLVHGAFAESASWDRVIDRLLDAGHPVIAAANPLRGLAADAEAVSDVVRTVDGPVVLVGHSYGGAVISNVAADAGEITGLVYVAGFAPEAGESAPHSRGPVPRQHARRGARAGAAQRRHHRPLHQQDLFHEQFAADVPASRRRRMAAAQRPDHPGGARPSPRATARCGRSCRPGSCSARRTATSRRALQHYMAGRARAHRTIEIPGASHAIAVAHPDATARLILHAAAVRARLA